MANTIPLWRQQLAMAVTIARSMEAGTTLKQASDLTNEGRRQRVEAEKQLITCEIELKQTLRAAQARNSTQTN